MKNIKMIVALASAILVLTGCGSNSKETKAEASSSTVESSSTAYSTFEIKNKGEFKMDLSSETSWIEALAHIAGGGDISYPDMIIVDADYNHTLNKIVEADPNMTGDQKQKIENGRAIMEKTIEIYKNAALDGRELTDTERSTVSSNVEEMMDVFREFASN